MKQNHLSQQFSRKQQVSVRRNFLLFSSILFFIIFALGGALFFTMIKKAAYQNAVSELTRLLEAEQFQMEAAVNAETALVQKMATSPLVRQHFSDPYDMRTAALFAEEMEGFRQIIKSRTLYWISDIDKKYYLTNAAPYVLDPQNPENDWYNAALRETRPYNFTIDYNPALKKTALWINAPVINLRREAIGVVGTYFDLNQFMGSIFQNNFAGAEVYFYNQDGQVSGARNLSLVENKTLLADALGPLGVKVMHETQNRLIAPQGVRIFEAAEGKNIVALCSIPTLGWYMVAVRTFSVGDFLPLGLMPLSILALGVFLLFILLSGLICAALIFGPLEKLSESLEHLGSNLGERIYGLERKDEFGHLAGAIDDMKNRISSIKYARRIQKNLLPSNALFQEAFADYSILWNPRDLVGGDIYWIKNYPHGSVLCVCDCTGHGTPGAMLTMLTVTALDALVTEKNCDDPAQIIMELDRRIWDTINADPESDKGPKGRRGADIKDGCDLAVLWLSAEGETRLAASGIDVLLCDGREVTRFKGQRLQVGSGKITAKEKVKERRFTAVGGQKLYIASDGLYEQTGGEKGLPMGFKPVTQVILENHHRSQWAISELIWRAFEEYRGDSIRCDDVLLISLLLNKEPTR